MTKVKKIEKKGNKKKLKPYLKSENIAVRYIAELFKTYPSLLIYDIMNVGITCLPFEKEIKQIDTIVFRLSYLRDHFFQIHANINGWKIQTDKSVETIVNDLLSHDSPLSWSATMNQAMKLLLKSESQIDEPYYSIFIEIRDTFLKIAAYQKEWDISDYNYN